jgi:hypothetical protein
MNYIDMSNELFKEVVRSNQGVNMNILDNIIRNNLEDKIKIYSEYGYFTSLTYETLLEKYNNYNLYLIVHRIKILNEKIIKIIVKNKKLEYLIILKSKFNYTLANILLEHSLLHDFQYGIDMALHCGANYILVLNKINCIYTKIND